MTHIVVALVFDIEKSQEDIGKAVTYFQQKNGDISHSNKLPIDFLRMDERQKIFIDSGKLRISLYKALLFKEIKEHIKAGSLNVISCYEYRSFEE